MHVLAIGNQKGGVSKTTTTAMLGVVLSRAGQRVHLIDMDPSSNLTTTFGLRDREGFLFDALSHRKALPVIDVAERLTITPSSPDLGRGEFEFIGQHSREFILKHSLERSNLPPGALVLIDCPPSLNVLAVNCLTAADSLLVVVQPGRFELEAFVTLQQTVDALKVQVNPQLQIIGAVLTNVHKRRKLTETVAAEVSRVYPLLGTVRADARMVEATSAGNLLRLRRSNALEDYQALGQKIRELI